MSAETIALIGNIVTSICTVVAVVLSNAKTQAVINQKVDDNNKFVSYQIDELTKRVEKHNNVIERMALVEQNIKTIWKQIDDIKGD